MAGGGASSLTWCGQPVLVLRGVVRDSLQHHPHGEGEHGGEEAIEDEVEEEDEGYGGGDRGSGSPWRTSPTLPHPSPTQRFFTGTDHRASGIS